MKSKWIAIAAASLAAAACGDADAPAGDAAAAAAPAAVAAPVEAAAPGPAEAVRSETVEAVFTGWEMGDYLWANLEIEGREASGAWVGPSPVDHFLEAHKGRPITLRIETAQVHIPEAGGTEQIERVVEARAGGLTAAQWWAGLSAAERKAAEARLEEVLGGGGG